MMELKRPEIRLEESEDKSQAKFIVEPLERGFGITLGNSLRRILLASLPGAAAVGVKISGVDHEFSSIKGIKEEVTEIILNLKEVRFKVLGDTDNFKRVECHLSSSKVGEVYASDIQLAPGIQVLTPDKLICTIDDGGKIDMTIYVDCGRGWVPAERNKTAKDPVGYISMDSLFTPVVKANFNVEPTRVDKSIDYDKLTIEVTTDGTISAKEIISLAAKVMNDHVKLFVELDENMSNGNVFVKKQESEETKALEISIDDLELGVRAYNCLKKAGIHKVSELIKMSEDDIMKLPNLGKRSLDEIINKLAELGLSLKSSED